MSRTRADPRGGIAGTERLLAALRAAPTPAHTLINASSIGVYGFGPPSDEQVDEDTAPLPGRYAAGSAGSAHVEESLQRTANRPPAAALNLVVTHRHRGLR